MSPISTRSLNLRPLLASILAILAITIGHVQAETWTDLRGTRSIEAKMLGLFEGNVVLRLEDGRRVTVPMAGLRSDSRIQAEKLALKLDGQRSTLVKELKAQAAEAAAPAPNPIPKPSPPPAYKKPTKDAKVVAALEHVDDQLRAGHLVVVFDSMPPSYRKDIDDIVKLAVAKMNATEWESLVGTLHKVGDLVVTRQTWFFSHPRLQAMPPESLEPTKDVLLLMSGMLRDGFAPEEMKLEKLQSMPFGEWLAERDKAMAPYLNELNELYGGDFRDYEVVTNKSGARGSSSGQYSPGGSESGSPGGSESGGASDAPASKAEVEEGDNVLVRITGSGTELETRMQRVEGFWVSAEQAEKWSEWVEMTKSRLQETPEGMLLTSNPMTMMPATLAPVLNPLTAAKDELQFHKAMESLFTQLQPLASMAGVTIDLASQSNSSNNGYSSNNYDDDENMGSPSSSSESREFNQADIGARFESDMQERERRMNAERNRSP